MAIMKSTRTLRERPTSTGNSGKSKKIKANKGAKVRIIEESAGWTKIEILDHANDPNPEGWVFHTAIDAKAEALGPLDEKEFAEECIEDAINFGVNAHYVMSIAHLRTKITDGPHNNGLDYGPFALSMLEWKRFGSRTEPDISMEDQQFKEWIAQCIVFSVITYVMQKKLAIGLDRQPTAAEMALAQMIGASAALRAIESPQEPISGILTAIPQSELDSDGIDKSRLPERYKEFLDGKKASESLSAVTEKLQLSLDDTAKMVAVAGQNIIASATDPVGAATHAGKQVIISETGLDILARVGQSEVAIFKIYSDEQLKLGLEAVVDTIINRVVHPSKEFPNTIEQVVNKREQFSAVTDAGGWNNLPNANSEITGIVEGHLVDRASGEASDIKGALHFLNPKKAGRKAREEWGDHVVANAVAHFGNENGEYVHYHGFAPGAKPPPAYTLTFRGRSFPFHGDGTPAQIGGGELGGSSGRGFSAPGGASITLDSTGKIAIGSDGLTIEYRGSDSCPYGRSATRNKTAFSGIVVHHNDPRASTQSLIRYQLRFDAKRRGHFGYHFYVSPRGKIFQGAPLTKRTNHVSPERHVRRQDVGRNIRNENAIGISCVRAGKKTGFDPTEEQINVVKALAFALIDLYNIPRGNIFGHGEIQTNKMESEGRSLAQEIRAT